MIEENNKVTVYNEMAFKIQRINTYWIALALLRENGYYGKAIRKLKTIELELISEAFRLDKDKKTNYIQQLRNINERISILSKTLKVLELYEAIIDKEQILRLLYNESGLEMKYSDENEDEMD